MTNLAMNITTTVTIRAMECPVCGVHYGLDGAFLERARKDGGRAWYCTNGHRLSFTETEAARLRKQLEQAEERIASERAWSERLSNNLRVEEKSHASTKGQLTKTRKRIQAGVCPDCHRHFENVERHMATKHATGVPV